MSTLCDLRNDPGPPLACERQRLPVTEVAAWISRSSTRSALLVLKKTQETLAQSHGLHPWVSQSESLVRVMALAIRAPLTIFTPSVCQTRSRSGGQMVHPASSARRDPTDGCRSFHGRQLSCLTPRSVTRAGGGLLDGKDAPFQNEGF